MPGPATSSSSEPPPRLALVTWDDESPTGGNIYNTALVAALRELDVEAEIVRVGGGWPHGTAQDRAELNAALAVHDVVLVDGIVAGNAPDEIAAAAQRARVGVILHLPLADEAGLSPEWQQRFLASERASLLAVQTVLCPSRHTADRLAARYDRTDAVIAAPAVERSGVAAGSTPPHLLCLGAVTPTKNQLALLGALRELTDLDWTASIVGSLTVAPDYAAEVIRAAAELDARVAVVGTVTGEDLQRIWAATDLLASTSRTETYGLVVAEALAHGIPAIVPAGTGAVEALGEVDGLPPGRAVDPAQLTSTLRDWLSTPELRATWRGLALRRRGSLPSWRATAEIVRDAMRG